LLITACLIMFVAMERVEAWIVIVILTREIGITGLRAFALEEGVQFRTTNWGKYKTIYQIIAVTALLIHDERRFLFFGMIDFHRVGTWFLYLAMFLTLFSGVDYVYKFWRALRG
ncbi:MAG: CDP-diacylglycerol--glycerol-3-phosphate 3-phosphatidyltransferase, partial [Deltaproteobacteria bacterium]